MNIVIVTVLRNKRINIETYILVLIGLHHQANKLTHVLRPRRLACAYETKELKELKYHQSESD
jgi:hypothetical protein